MARELVVSFRKWLMARRYRCVDDQVRLSRLSELLERNGSLAVRHNTWGWSGDRAHIELDDHSVLKLSLLWASSQVLAALVSMSFIPDIGWIVIARSSAGAQVELRAYYASIDLLPPPPLETSPVPSPTT